MRWRRLIPRRSQLKYRWSLVVLTWYRLKAWRSRQFLRWLDFPPFMKLTIWWHRQKLKNQNPPSQAKAKTTNFPDTPFRRSKVWWKREQPTNQPEEISPFDLNYPLLQLSQYPEDTYYLQDALEGVLIMGGSGSGKTSGSGKVLAKTFLHAGYGGLVLCGKVEEANLWKEYAQAVGREDQLVILNANAKWRFNFLNYEYQRNSNKNSAKRNIVHLFSLMGELQNPTHRGGEPFWRNEADKLLGHAIEVLTTLQNSLSLFDIHRFVMSAPLSQEQLNNQTWKEKSICFRCVETAGKAAGKNRDFLLAKEYWLQEFPNMPDKTRANVVSSFTGSAHHLMSGDMGNLFCEDTNITPEDTAEGAIIVLDLPPDEDQQDGLIAQMMFKYFWQAAIKRRKVTSDTRPVFLWGDESQFFLNRYDSGFLRTARSARAATVYMAQDVSSYYASLGSRDQANTLLANFQTKIFHRNTDPETNEYAARHCAKSFQKRTGTSYSASQKQSNAFFFPQKDNEPTTNTGFATNEHLEYNIQPEEFHHLRQGGFDNDLPVDGILLKAGRQWQLTEGKSFLPVAFPQDF